MTDALVLTESGGTITIVGDVLDRIVRRAVEVLQELAELAKQVEVELARAKSDAEAGG